MKVKVIEIKHVNLFDLVRENRQLRETLDQADIEIARYKGSAESLMQELCEANHKVYQLERAVRQQSACWMCEKNHECHKNDPCKNPQCGDVMCGNFKFKYKHPDKFNSDCCEYKHGKQCWGQKDAPMCVPEFCPVKEKKEVTLICFDGDSQL